MPILLATTSLGIFIAVKVVHKQPDRNGILYLQNVLLLMFYPYFEDHTLFIVMPDDIGVIPVGTLLLGVSFIFHTVQYMKFLYTL